MQYWKQGLSDFFAGSQNATKPIQNEEACFYESQKKLIVPRDAGAQLIKAPQRSQSSQYLIKPGKR